MTMTTLYLQEKEFVPTSESMIIMVGSIAEWQQAGRHRAAAISESLHVDT